MQKYFKILILSLYNVQVCMYKCTGWYLPVQSSFVTIKWVHYDEKFTVLFFQVFHVFALRLIILYHFHDGHLRFVSQSPESAEWKFDDKLQILSKYGQSNTETEKIYKIKIKLLHLNHKKSWALHTVFEKTTLTFQLGCAARLIKY